MFYYNYARFYFIEIPLFKLEIVHIVYQLNSNYSHKE